MIYIGTSGWSYQHWHNGVFYPSELEKGKELEYYTTKFKTVEINSTFYHLPRETTWKNWVKRTPKDFIFAIKGSRFITHVLKLDNPSDPLENLINGSVQLGPKLGPILFQFPPKFQLEFPRLEKFVGLLPKKRRFTFEFRHQSWFTSKVYELLKKNNLALTIADTPVYPMEEKVTADFIYVRLHGTAKLYASEYTPPQLEEWAKKIKRWLTKELDVYVYFDNDAHGYAPKNASELISLI